MHFATTFKPQNYDLYFDLDRQQKHFFGKTTITGLALTETVWLHQKNFRSLKSWSMGNLTPLTLMKQKMPFT